jgi:SAM-dependent methyltransferase
MTTLSSEAACPVCEHEGSALANGVVAPFISTLSGLPLGQPTVLRRCESCDLAYFDARYGDDELSSIYGSYRSSRYKAIRHRWEPWYSRSVNDACSGETQLVRQRRAFMMDILRRGGIGSELECVVDFGGDEGQFFPSIPTGRRVVCEVSKRTLPEGIEQIESLDELGNPPPDLVIVAHVLEHLPRPLDPLREIRRKISPRGLLYIEIPLDAFRVAAFHSGIRYRDYLARLVRSRAGFVAMDLITGLSRRYRSRVPRLGVVKQSEHINYFSPSSLHTALARAGFSVVAENTEPPALARSFSTYGVAARPI